MKSEILEKKIILPSNFEQLVDLFQKKQELLLHAQLISSVHLVSFKKGVVNLKLSGNTSNNLLNQVSVKLKEWTGENWIINEVEEMGEETITERNTRVNNEKLDKARSTPEMEKVLKAFPNASIKSVKNINIKQGDPSINLKYKISKDFEED